MHALSHSSHEISNATPILIMLMEHHAHIVVILRHETKVQKSVLYNSIMVRNVIYQNATQCSG